MISNPKAYREGFADAILGRESNNPYSWNKVLSMNSYSHGYHIGKRQRLAYGISLKVDLA